MKTHVVLEGREGTSTHMILEAWRERVAGDAARDADASRHDVVPLRVKVTEVEVVGVAEVGLRVLETESVT